MVLWIRYPVVSLHSTTGYKLKSLRLEEGMFVGLANREIGCVFHPGRDDSL
jgi:hypothetical protein